MFTFHWSELLIIVLGGLVLFLGLALLMLRRRNEILQIFLTPESPDIEQEFFRIRASAEAQELSEEPAAMPEETETAATVESEETVQWGTPQDE